MLERPELTPEIVQAAADRIRQTRKNYAAGRSGFITIVCDNVQLPLGWDYSTDLNILADWACQELETR